MKVLTEATELVDTAGGTAEGVVDDLLDMVGLGGLSVSGFLPDISLVEVEVRSPVTGDFETGTDWQDRQAGRAQSIDSHGPLNYPDKELDFDSSGMVMDEPRTDRLAVEVRILVPMRIPLVNWIFFQLWYAQEELRTASQNSKLQDWAQFKAKTNGGRYLEDVVRDSNGSQVFDDALLTSQRTKEARLLRDLATSRLHIYMIPLRASYAMQMQSNPFWDNRRQPVWFSLSD